MTLLTSVVGAMGAVMCIVGCLAVSWPLLVDDSSTPLPAAVATVSISKTLPNVSLQGAK